MPINLFKTKNKLPNIIYFPRLDIFRKLMLKEEISALEINDGFIRLLNLGYSDEKIKVISGNEEEITPGLIEKGKIKNPDKLTEIIKNLFKNAGPNPIISPYIIISIPEINNFSFTLTLPIMAKETINEAIADNITNLLPQPINNYYIDWQELKETKIEFNKFKILISAAEKNIIDEYGSIFEKIGLNLIALETPSISIGRAIKLTGKTNFVIISKIDGLIESIYESGELIFNRFVPRLEILPEEKENVKDFSDENIFKKGLEEEIKKMANFYGSMPAADIKNLTVIICGEKYDFDKIAKELSVKMDLIIQPSITIFENLKDEFPFSDPAWQTTIGTALRTLIPRKEDIVISLLPIGTEEIYARQKLNSFLTALNKFVLFSSVLSIIILLGTFIYFKIDLLDSNKRLSAISYINLPPEIASLEKQAENFNKSVANIIQIESEIKNPSPQLNDLINLIPVGIAINKVNITADSKSPITLSGKALTLDALMIFRQNLSESLKFKDIKIPINALTKKENIDFNISVIYAKPE